MTTDIFIALGVVIILQGYAVKWYIDQIQSADKRAMKEAELVMIVALAHYMADAVADRNDIWDGLTFDAQLDYQRDAKNWLQGFYRSRMEAQA